MAQLLRIAAVIASALVLLGFGLFANEQVKAGSDSQIAKINPEVNQPAPAAADEQQRERLHGKAHEVIDDANDVLLAPFAGLVSPHDDPWVQRMIPGVLALLVYGLGLFMLANFLPKSSNETTDWRSAGTT